MLQQRSRARHTEWRFCPCLDGWIARRVVGCQITAADPRHLEQLLNAPTSRASINTSVRNGNCWCALRRSASLAARPPSKACGDPQPLRRLPAPRKAIFECPGSTIFRLTFPGSW
ncbi:hypothetical protein GCM10010411_55820 [Actinomadura fulvescens]|uniref:Uncharacterized protein n=1 Tax=Actinomadura fulvescens TaxID=46160 RepID=A0ABN3Q2G4_9ACTN